MNRRDALGACLAQGVACAALHAATPDHDTARLRADIERIARAVGGTTGVGAWHIESGRGIALNRDLRFPMASLFKLALALQFLARVDAGVADLDKTLLLQSSDLRGGSGTLSKGFREPRPISLRELLQAMLIDSDNSATDLLWREAGGSRAVMARLAALGIRGMSVDRPAALLLAAARQGTLFDDDRDTTTPQAVMALLLTIWRGEALSPNRTALLLDIMSRCATGSRRLRGRLPAITPVAHKTGTFRPGVTNDAGIVSLPGTAGHLAIAVLIKQSPRDLATQERAIADIARAACDHFAGEPLGPR